MQAAKLYRLLVLTLVGLAGCSSASNLNARNPFDENRDVKLTDWASQKSLGRLRIFFSGNVSGSLATCGCSVNPKGGLDRRLNFLRRSKEGPATLIVDAGNSLFPTMNLDPSHAAKLRKDAKTLLAAQVLMGIAVQNVGYLDLSAGPEFLISAAKESGLKLVSANWQSADGKALFEAKSIIDVGGIKVIVTGLSSGGAGEAGEKLKVEDPLTALLRVASSAPSDALLVVLSDLGTSRDEELGRQVGRPTVFIGARDLSSLESPLHRGPSLIVQPQLQGAQWGVLDLVYRPGAQAWFNTTLAARFYERWRDLASEKNRLNALPSGEDRTAELDRVERAAQEMRNYESGNLDSKIVYEHRLVDMLETYDGKNELTAVMPQNPAAKKHSWN